MVSGSWACTSIGKAEVGGQVAADLVPGVAGVVAAHHIPMLLHEQHVRPRRVHGDAVHAVADLGLRVRDDSRSAGPWLIGCHVWPPSSRAEGAGRGDGDEDALGIAGVEEDGVQAHAAGARLPAGPGAVAAQPGQLLPGLPAVGGAEQGGIFHAGINRVGIVRRRLKMPDAVELPRMRRAVVPLVRAGHALVHELVADRLPGLAAIVGALDDLPKPAAGLRGVEAVGFDGRAFQMVNLPAAEDAGRSTCQVSRLPSAVRMKAPLRVPTSTLTALMKILLV